MAVEIEEMTATVEPETATQPKEPAQAAQPRPTAANLDSDLRHWTRRQLRLRAD